MKPFHLYDDTHHPFMRHNILVIKLVAMELILLRQYIYQDMSLEG
jgi:hypothetical protein